ncbi:MAG: leucine-rich repeat protein, partial [Bacteroidales bacterium]|nr:leucine-rich repeat protein [Bacteroidales bacterium]
HCSSLTSVTIPNSVTSIGYCAFSDCSSLTSITIPDSVTSIEAGAFYDCSSLTSITIPNSVTSIEGSTFYGCSSLTSITIPDSVTSIEGSAFSYCTGLTSIYYGAKVPIECSPQLFSDETYVMATLYMSDEGIEIGRTINPWKNFLNIEVQDSSAVKDVFSDFDDNAPYEIYNINGVKIGNSFDGLSRGIYIVRQGVTAKKVVVK